MTKLPHCVLEQDISHRSRRRNDPLLICVEGRESEREEHSGLQPFHPGMRLSNHLRHRLVRLRFRHVEQNQLRRKVQILIQGEVRLHFAILQVKEHH